MSASDREQYEDEIIRLFYDEKWSQRKVMQYMLNKYGFRATPRQYRTIREKSGRSKNLTSPVWGYILHQIALRRDSGRESEIYWHGKRVPQVQIEREQKRPRAIHQSTCGMDLSRLEIRTPPPLMMHGHQTNDEACFSETTEQSSWQPLTESQQEETALSPYAPSEAMTELDYTCVETLTWATLVLDIPIFGRNMHYLFGQSAKDFPFSFNRFAVGLLEASIPISPDHSWSWEALATILSDNRLSDLRREIPGFPKTEVRLHDCSSSNLLNITINLIVNFQRLSSVTKCIEPLFNWLVDERHLELVRFILKSRDHRIQAFAWNLIKDLAKVYEQSILRQTGSSISTSAIKPVIRLCYEVIREPISTPMSMQHKTGLLTSVATFSIPELSREVIASGVTLNTNELWRKAMASSDYSLIEQLLMLDKAPHIQHDIELTIWEAWKHREIGVRRQDLYEPVSFLASHDVDLDVVTGKFFPFTLAQAIAFTSPSLCDLIRYCTKHSITLRLAIALQNPENLESLQALSDPEREFLLLGATGFDKLELARSLINEGTNPNCRQASAIIQQACARCTHYFGIYPAVCSKSGSVMNNWLKKRWIVKKRDPALKKPIEIAIESCSIMFLELFLSVGIDEFSALLRGNHSIRHDLRFLKQISHLLLRPGLLPLTSHLLLHLAIETGDFELLNALTQSLIELGYSEKSCLNAVSDFGLCLEGSCSSRPVTALTLALRWSNLDTLGFLWEHGARFYHEGMFSGAHELAELCSLVWDIPNNLFYEKLEFLLSKGASLRCADEDHAPLQALYENPITCSAKKGFSILNERITQAKMPGVLEVMRLLVTMGADHDLKESIHSTPLQRAAQCGHFEAVRYLLEQGADVNLVLGHPPVPALVWLCADTERRPPIQLAQSPEQLETVQFLLSSGADLSLGELGLHRNQYKDGWTALGRACVSRRRDLIELLMQNGADLRAPPASGSSYLQLACLGRHSPLGHSSIEIAQFLLDSGASVNTTVSHVESALQRATHNGDFELVLLLLMAGADVNYVPSNCEPDLSEPAICFAVTRQHYDIVKVLLNAGANKGLDSAFKRADRHGYFNIARLLENHRGVAL